MSATHTNSSSTQGSGMALVIVSGLVGLLFGFGLVVSGMSNPAKVIGFLDLSNPWDPSLMLVMGGAIAVGVPGFMWAKKLNKSLLGLDMNLPNNKTIDKRLLVGSAMFGAGWGIGGFCPGPALVAASSLFTDALLFTASMAVGMWLYGRFLSK